MSRRRGKKPKPTGGGGRSGLSEVATETVEISERGTYVAPSGKTVDIRNAIHAATSGTRLFVPEDVAALIGPEPAPSAGRGAATVVTDETTAAAGRRLAAQGAPVLILNYASARNPGGGVLTGARAQEEALCRCSALLVCLRTQPTYYEVNRAQRSLLYTDHLIVSPGVPWFRDEELTLLEVPFALSVITSPAPNAGEARRRGDSAAAIRATLRRRAGQVLAVAKGQGARALVLGAWGCGVFGNDPAEVASAFGDWLADPAFSDAFDPVVFAIPRRVAANHEAFAQRFG